MTSACLDVSGTIAGGVTLNPVVLGTISGSLVLLKTRSEIKNYRKKIELQATFSISALLQVNQSKDPLYQRLGHSKKTPMTETQRQSFHISP